MPSTSSDSRLPLVVIGVGAIGRLHVLRALVHPQVRVVGVADPSPAAAAFARAHGLPCFEDHRALLDTVAPRAVIVATPNALHVAAAHEAISRGLPVLIEKPVADRVDEALALLQRADELRVPVMVGHQRRHNPIMRRAVELVRGGAIGRPVSATVMATWLKPDRYFEDGPWRRQAGAGPVLINLIHDIDQLRALLGEVCEVQAFTSRAVRGFEVEDTAAATLRFAQGALATLSVTDAAVTPWNWDLAAGEVAHYAQTPVDSHFIAGTEGSLTLPRLDLWRHDGARGWHEPLTCSRTTMHREDPYVEQLRHLRAVVEGQEAPRCSGWEGLRTLQATLAVLASAEQRVPVTCEPLRGRHEAPTAPADACLRGTMP